MIALQCCLNFCCCLVGKSCLTLGDLTDCSLPGLGFPRQEYWSGLPFPSPGDPPDPGIETASPALAGRFFTTEPPGKPCISLYIHTHISPLFWISFPFRSAQCLSGVPCATQLVLIS